MRTWTPSIRQLLTLLLFTGIFVFSYTLQSAIGTFNTVDAFYHSAQARAYVEGESLAYPYFTYMTEYPADIWILYHYALAAIDHLTPSDSYESLLHESYLFHAFLSTITIGLLLKVLEEYYRLMVPQYRTGVAKIVGTFSYKVISPTILQLLVLGFFLFFSVEFLMRIGFTQRPHIGMLFLVLLGILAIIRSNKKLLFIASVIAPLWYSFALFILIPATIPLTGWFFTGRKRTALKESLTPFLVSVAGIIIGITIHPQSIGYLINGIGFVGYAIVQSAFFWINSDWSQQAIAGEMLAMQTVSISHQILMLLSISAAFYSYKLQELSSIELRLQRINIGMSFTALGLMIASSFIQRTTEYAYPIAIIVTIVFAAAVAFPVTLFMYQEILLERSSQAKKRVIIFINGVITLLSYRLTKIILAAVTLTVASAHIIQVHSAFADLSVVEFDRYRGAAEFISSQQTPGVVVMPLYDHYGQLTFYGDYGCQKGACVTSLASGMDGRMVYFYSPTIFSKLSLFLGNTRACALRAECGVKDSEAGTVTMEELNIVYLLHDSKNTVPPIDLIEFQNTLIDSYSFLTPVYQDEKYPEVRVYGRSSEAFNTAY